MNNSRQPQTLLAVETTVRSSGWAVFRDGEIAATGTIALRSSGPVGFQARIAHLIKNLDRLAETWAVQAVALGQPTRVGSRTSSLVQLDSALSRWRHDRPWTCHCYTAPQVKAALTGNPHASRGVVSHLVMTHFGLIGQQKTHYEWAALAIGHHHLTTHPISPKVPKSPNI